MKTYYIVLFTLLTLSSCKKFLDEPQNSRLGPLNSVEACQVILDAGPGFNDTYPIDGESYADNYYLDDDALGSLFAPESKGIYLRLPTAQRLLSNPYGVNIAHWKKPYERIYNVNVLLEALENIDPGTTVNEQAAYNEAKGASLFHRGFNLYQVVSLYGKAYDPSTATQDMGVPVRVQSDINIAPERGTLQQSYDQVIKDLQAAVNLLPVTTVKASRPNKAAAYAALARVYLAMSDYATAGTAANAALQLNGTLIDYNTVNVNADQPFVIFNKEVLFHASSIYDELLEPSYTKVNPELYDLYAVNDLRKLLFYKANGDGSYQFKGGYGGSNTNLWAGIAIDELYLIRAESFARAGNATAAMTDLNTLLKNRYVNTSTNPYINISAANAADALDKVLAERRKELAFRSGLRWSDLKRLNKETGYAVTLFRSFGGTRYELPPNDLRYQLLLPEDVMLYGKLPENPR